MELQKNKDHRYWKPTDEHYLKHGFGVDDFAQKFID